MRLRYWLTGCAIALTFAGGLLIGNMAPWTGLRAQLPANLSISLPYAAQHSWFPPLDEYTNGGEPLEERKFATLFSRLQERLAAKETRADFEREAAIYIHSFIRRISNPALTPNQLERATAFFAQLRDTYPEHGFLIDRHRAKLERSAPGKSWAQPFYMATSWFPKIETRQAETGQFSDGTIEELIGVLESLLSMPETVLDIEREAGSHIRSFAHALQQRRLTGKQIALAVSYLSEVKARHPALGELIDRSRYRIEKLTPGQLAPNITGTDLNSIDFQLQDYRGNVVVLYFTGQWCGPCRSEYPYQRFMLEIFKGQPVSLLAVNSDDDRDYALSAGEDAGLHFRAWWDGYGEHHAMGPIATAWDVKEWPTIYVLDANGVIRYVRKRHLEVVRVAQALLDEMPGDAIQVPRSET